MTRSSLLSAPGRVSEPHGARVEAGETIQITDRGRPVAVLAPLPDRSPIQRLRAAGDLVSSQHDLDDLPDPLPLAAGQEPPSSVLARLRRDER